MCALLFPVSQPWQRALSWEFWSCCLIVAAVPILDANNNTQWVLCVALPSLWGECSFRRLDNEVGTHEAATPARCVYVLGAMRLNVQTAFKGKKPNKILLLKCSQCLFKLQEPWQYMLVHPFNRAHKFQSWKFLLKSLTCHVQVQGFCGFSKEQKLCFSLPWRPFCWKCLHLKYLKLWP